MKLPFAFELVVASALVWRGMDVLFVLCDGLPNGCLLRSAEHGTGVSDWPEHCETCCNTGTSLIESLGLPYRYAGEWVSPSRRAELRALAETVPLDQILPWRHYGVSVGRHALSSTERYQKGIEPTDAPENEEVIREYFCAGLMNTEASKGVLDEFQPERVFTSHGIYVDWGPIFDLVRKANIPVTRWMAGYRKGHVYLKTSMPDDSRHLFYLGDREWEKRKTEPLSEREKARLDGYMADQSLGAYRYRIFEGPPLDTNTLRQRLDLPKEKPVWGVFTHLNWDAVFAFEPMLFKDPTEWTLETLRVILKIPEVTWFVKIHPSERVLGTARGCEELIAGHFPSLPDHIRIIPAESNLNTYGLLPVLDGGVTIRGTVGMELAMLGKPVILAGEAHYAGKGFTYGSRSRDEYFDRLREAGRLPPLSSEQIGLAQSYAHSLFVERQVPFRFISEPDGEHDIRLNFQSLEDLRPNRDSVLDFICERVLTGGEFILDKELLEETSREQLDCPTKGDARTLNRRGEQLHAEGDKEGAVKFFSMALQADPDLAVVHNNLGVVYWEGGDVERAVEHLVRALEIQPDHRDVLSNCAEILGRSDGWQDPKTSALMYLLFVHLAHLSDEP